jgi:hypothetical protein
MRAPEATTMRINGICAWDLIDFAKEVYANEIQIFHQSVSRGVICETLVRRHRAGQQPVVLVRHWLGTDIPDLLQLKNASADAIVALEDENSRPIPLPVALNLHSPTIDFASLAVDPRARFAICLYTDMVGIKLLSETEL